MHLARLVPLLLVAFLISACGASDTPSTRFIAQSRAADFQTTLDAVEEDLEADRCDQAASGIVRLRAQADGWPSAYDAELVSNVLQWIDRIDVRLATDCGEEEPTPSATPELTPTPEEETPTPSATPEETPTPQEETPTPSATPEPPETPDPIPTPPADVAPDTGGADGGEG